MLRGKYPLTELSLSPGHPGLDLLPAHFSHRHFDVHLSKRKRPTERLLKLGRPLREIYSTLFLDCAPGSAAARIYARLLAEISRKMGV